MARQSSVNAAYSPINGKSSNAWSRLCASTAIAAFLVFFLFSGGNSGNPNNDNLRSGQAHHETSANEPIAAETKQVVEPNAPADSYAPADPHSESIENAVMDEENLQEAMDEARDDIKEAEEAQLQEEGKMLDTATSGMANMVRIGIGRLFGSTLTNDEVEQVANQVEGQLKIEANKMLRTRADTITNREIDNLEGMVEEEEESGLLTDEIGADVSEQGFGAAIAVKDDIDAAAISIKDSLKARATEIEKAILEERLSAKLGKRVKLVIMDDELKVEGDDALFLGLNTLAPPATTTYENSAYPPSTVTTTGYNPYINPYVSSTAVPPATPSFGAPPVTAYGADPRSRYSVPPPRSPYDPAPTTHGSVTSPAKTYTYNKDTYGNPSYTTTTTNGAGKDYDVPGVAAPDKKEEKLGDHGDDSKDSGDWK